MGLIIIIILSVIVGFVATTLLSQKNEKGGFTFFRGAVLSFLTLVIILAIGVALDII